MTTFVAIGQNSKLDFVSFNADAQRKLEKLDGQGLMITEIVLRPRLTVANARDAERAARVLSKAEKVCLISNSVKTKIRLEPEISLAAQASLYATPRSATLRRFNS